jgi:hypothetical protein
MNRACCGRSQAKKRSQDVSGLLKLPGQETQLGILGMLKLVLCSTAMERYRTYWNAME